MIDLIVVAGLTPELSDAIVTRLQFRSDVLEMLMKHADSMSPPETFFASMQDRLLSIQKGHNIGKEVPEAFSTKLQRRLASTVPSTLR